MKVEVLKSFEKDIAKINDKSLAKKILAVIEELEAIQSLNDIHNLK